MSISLTLPRGLALVPLWFGALVLSGCFLYQSGTANCHDHLPCPTGQYCDDNLNTCQPGAGPDMTMLSTGDMFGVDAANAQKDLFSPPDLAPECMTESDCPTNSGLSCKAGKCVPCALHSDCEGLICDVYQQNSKGTAGKCLGLSTVVYVDNKNGGACASGTGGQINPVCSIPEAVAKLDATKVNIQVKASSAFYAPLTLSLAGKAATIYGPAGQSGSARIGGSATALTETDNSTVLIDGMDIATGVVGVRCTGTSASLTLHRGTVSGFTAAAMIIGGCKLDMDRMTVTGNGNAADTNPAILISGVTGYSVTNSFIVKNASQTQAVISLTGNTTGSFRFNTVADNTTAFVTAGGFDCTQVTSGADNHLQDSIFFGNSRDPVAATQIVGTCALSQVVVGQGDMTSGGLNMKSPTFTAPATGDYRLKAGADNSCCVDQAMGMTDHDYFGVKRPLGKGYDIGAHEAN